MHVQVNELYELERLAMLRDGVRCRMESTYDRSGGNDDDFNGTYSRLRAEGEDSVLAEMTGAGCIQRIWFTYSAIDSDHLLNNQGEHIRFYLDGEDEPRIDIPIKDLFSGNLDAFPRPIVGEGTGGFYCYVTIPYQDGCKIVIDGDGARFWPITYNSYESAEGVGTFSMEMSEAQLDDLARAVSCWGDPGQTQTQALAAANGETESHHLVLGAQIDLPDGPHVIRSIQIEGTPEQLLQAGEAWIDIYWDDAESAAVSMPLSFLFGQSLRGTLCQSLLVGADAERWYCHLPMPYRRSRRIVIRAAESLDINLSILSKPLPRPHDQWGYFHGLWHEENPTTAGQHYPWLIIAEGKGHYVGVILDTERQRGQTGMPIWLEGDETFVINGEMDIHGTGTEYYFNCGWYAVEGRLAQAGIYPRHGYIAFHQGEPVTSATSYRFHLTDPVPFEGSISAQIEHGPTNNVLAHYRSVVFYYLSVPGLPHDANPMP